MLFSLVLNPCQVSGKLGFSPRTFMIVYFHGVQRHRQLSNYIVWKHQIELNNYTDASAWGIKSYQNNTLFLTEWEEIIVLEQLPSLNLTPSRPLWVVLLLCTQTWKQLKTLRNALLWVGPACLRSIMWVPFSSYYCLYFSFCFCCYCCLFVKDNVFVYCFVLSCYLFEKGPHYIAQTGLELTI